MYINRSATLSRWCGTGARRYGCCYSRETLLEIPCNRQRLSLLKILRRWRFACSLVALWHLHILAFAHFIYMSLFSLTVVRFTRHLRGWCVAISPLRIYRHCPIFDFEVILFLFNNCC